MRVFHQAHIIAPQMGLDRQSKDRLQKGLTVNSNTVVLGT